MRVKLFSLFIFLFSLGFYLYHLGQPNRLYWDEIIHVSSARSILVGHQPYAEMAQPPLGKELIALSLYFFGDNPQGARVLSAFCGALSLSFFFLCAYELCQNLALSVFSILLLAFDPLFYVHSRLAMLDMFLIFFIGISLYKFLLIFKKSEKNIKIFDFYLLGSLLGLAISVKSVALVLAFPFIFLLGQKIKLLPAQKRNKMFVHLFLGLLLPFVVLFRISYSIIGYSWKEMFEQLSWAATFLSTFKAHPSITSRWYEWIFVQKPILYVLEEAANQQYWVVIAFGNYLFWIWAEGMILVGLFFFRKMPPMFWALLSMIVLQFLFWSFKPTTHLYYMLTVLPFYSLLMVQVLHFLMQEFPAKKRVLSFNIILFTLGCLILFIYYFPLISGAPISLEEVESYKVLGIEKTL